ncbi:hypothetical protein PV325_005743 [Microctonus aethiopoides]|nr:hypothetical protein PV325_005743 [Microctonus aethiopoides]
MMEPGQLSKDQKKQLKVAFDTFDKDKKGIIKTDEVATILGMMGIEFDANSNLESEIAEVDIFGSGELKYEDFCQVASKFMEEDVDVEALKVELKEAFRLYDREGNGYITTDVFREILSEIDENLNDDELDMMIDEIDADGSGTLDFEEFVEAMTH